MRLWKRLYEGKESFLQNKDIATQKPFQSRLNCSLSFRPVELAPMKKRSLPASVCSECSFLLKELTKLQENHGFFNEGLPQFMETNTTVAADAEPGLQAKDFADNRQHYGSLRHYRQTRRRNTESRSQV
jgi:hypothetical protein